MYFSISNSDIILIRYENYERIAFIKVFAKFSVINSVNLLIGIFHKQIKYFLIKFDNKM